jgi:SAM-dependent methyltransferase
MAIPRVGRHYRGELGAAYFSAYEAGISGVVDEVESRKFAMYIVPGDAVVDFGCGNGGVLACLEARTKIGIEVNEQARQAASERGISVVASTDELPDQCADVVISNHALEHTVAPVEELKELRRILKPEGKLVLWLPLDNWRAQRRVRRDPNHHLIPGRRCSSGTFLTKPGSSCTSVEL